MNSVNLIVLSWISDTSTKKNHILCKKSYNISHFKGSITFYTMSSNIIKVWLEKKRFKQIFFLKQHVLNVDNNILGSNIPLTRRNSKHFKSHSNGCTLKIE